MAVERDAVVLLHGLARGPWSMAPLAWRLGRQGYTVHNVSYPSRPRSFEQAVAAVEHELARRGLDREDPLKWVTYSLGGLVARAYVTRHDRLQDRLVMLAPPNHGSEIVDVIGRQRWFRVAFGEMASELGTEDESLPSRVEVPPIDIGVIAGSRWINPLGRWLLESEHDGTVTVESTRLSGMSDHIVVPHSHSFLMNAPRVANEAAHFLEHGRFRPAGG